MAHAEGDNRRKITPAAAPAGLPRRPLGFPAFEVDRREPLLPLFGSQDRDGHCRHVGDVHYDTHSVRDGVRTMRSRISGWLVGLFVCFPFLGWAPVVAQPLPPAALPASNPDVIACAKGQIAGCKSLSDALNPVCNKPNPGHAPTAGEVACLNQLILSQQLWEALRRAAEVCATSATSNDCSFATNRAFETTAAFSKQAGILIATVNPLTGAPPDQRAVDLLLNHTFATCDGTVTDPLDVSRRIVSRIQDQFGLQAIPASETASYVSLLDTEAVTTRDVIKRMIALHDSMISPGTTTEVAVRFLASRLLNRPAGDIPQATIDSLVRAAQTGGGLHAAANVILDGDEYLNVIGDFRVPGSVNYLPCRIVVPGAVAYASKACRDNNRNDPSQTVTVHVPRGYLGVGKWWVTTENPTDGSATNASVCVGGGTGRFYLSVAAHHSNQCTELGPFELGPGHTWVGAEIAMSGDYTGYLFHEDPDNCPQRHAISHPSWASNPPVTCGPALPMAGSTCAISASAPVAIDVFDRNRCGEEGAKLQSLTLSTGDSFQVAARSGFILYRLKPAGGASFSADKLSPCLNGNAITIP